jgi:sulfur carrier protein ThiS
LGKKAMPAYNIIKNGEGFWLPMIVTLPGLQPQDIGDKRCAISGILARFGINPLEVIVSVNGRVVPEDAMVSGSDRIRIIRIAHGG